jgi:hypothetical protein
MRGVIKVAISPSSFDGAIQRKTALYWAPEKPS